MFKSVFKGPVASSPASQPAERPLVSLEYGVLTLHTPRPTVKKSEAVVATKRAPESLEPSAELLAQFLVRKFNIPANRVAVQGDTVVVREPFLFESDKARKAEVDRWGEDGEIYGKFRDSFGWHLSRVSTSTTSDTRRYKSMSGFYETRIRPEPHPEYIHTWDSPTPREFNIRPY